MTLLLPAQICEGGNNFGGQNVWSTGKNIILFRKTPGNAHNDHIFWTFWRNGPFGPPGYAFVRGPCVLFRNSLMMWQLCAAENQRPYVFNWRTNLNRPCYAQKRDGSHTPLLNGQHNSAVTECGTRQKRGRAITRGPIINQGETSRKDKTQAKIRSDSANVTKSVFSATGRFVAKLRNRLNDKNMLWFWLVRITNTVYIKLCLTWYFANKLRIDQQ